MRLLTNADVASVLDMRGGIAAPRTGYDDLARGDAAFIPPIDLYAPPVETTTTTSWGQWPTPAGRTALWPSASNPTSPPGPRGARSKSTASSRATTQGIILLYSISNGAPLALLQDGYLQHVRVGVAGRRRGRTDGPARRRQPGINWVRRHGTDLPGGDRRGPQATRGARLQFHTGQPRAIAATAGEELGLDIRAVDSAKEAVTGARIVATATDSMTARQGSQEPASSTVERVATKVRPRAPLKQTACESAAGRRSTGHPGELDRVPAAMPTSA